MWEGIITGVATFLLCELLRIIYKKSNGKIKTSIRNIKRRLKGNYTLRDLIIIEKLPEEKRTRRQKALYDKYKKDLEEFNLKNADKLEQIQAMFKSMPK